MKNVTMLANQVQIDWFITTIPCQGCDRRICDHSCEWWKHSIKIMSPCRAGEYISSNYETFSQCLLNIGPPSTPLAQHWASFGRTSRVCWAGLLNQDRWCNALGGSSPITLISLWPRNILEVIQLSRIPHIVTLVSNGRICPFTKWQIPPFDTKVTMCMRCLYLPVTFWCHYTLFSITTRHTVTKAELFCSD